VEAPSHQNDLGLHQLDVQNMGYNIKDAQTLIAQYKECDLCLLLAYLAMDLDTVETKTGGVSDLPAGSLQSRPIKLLLPRGYQTASDGSLRLQHVRVAFPEVLNSNHSRYSTPYISTGRLLNLAQTLVSVLVGVECSSASKQNSLTSPAALNRDIIGRSRSSSSNGEEAFGLLRSRLATCLEQYGGVCDRTISGETIDTMVPLPTRLLHINKDDHG
jgi:hypothetical protein